MKQKILKTAVDMFLNYGFKSVTMDDIANEMGISKKTIYVHFPNKTKLSQKSLQKEYPHKRSVTPTLKKYLEEKEIRKKNYY